LKSGPDTRERATLVAGSRFHTKVSSSGSVNGSGRNSTAFATLKIATLLPIPSARVRTMTPVKSGFLANERTAYFTSRSRSAIMGDLGVTGGAAGVRLGRTVRLPLR
jgi:hypothetical protein